MIIDFNTETNLRSLALHILNKLLNIPKTLQEL